MVTLSTTEELQTIKFIPRLFTTSDVKIDLTDDITGDVLSSGETSTFERTGDFITASVGFTGLNEDRFYTLRYIRNTDSEVVYKDKAFVTNQTIDQVNDETYTINKDKYVEKETSNNDYIVL
jgi:hypothetical protein